MNLLNVTRTITTVSLIGCNILLAAAAADEGAKRINDTGIYYGGNYPKGINTNCIANIQSFDVTSAQAESFISQQDCATRPNMAGKKRRAFSYIKVSDTGQALPASAERWQCVNDKVSGLMWEVKQTDRASNKLHFKDDKFTWYNSNPKLNGGNIGSWNQQGSQCHGYAKGKPRSYCHVEQFVSRVNKKGLCGFTDWRLPTRAELTSLIHFGEFQPAIDSNYFPHTLSNFYWTLNPVAGRPIEAWSINFEFGYSSPLRKTDLRPARLVRSMKSGEATKGDK